MQVESEKDGASEREALVLQITTLHAEAAAAKQQQQQRLAALEQRYKVPETVMGCSAYVPCLTHGIPHIHVGGGL